jgi:hypothetical protein
MLLPTILLHDEFDGARQFVQLLDKKAHTEWVVEDPSTSCIPRQQPQRTPNYDWASPELIAEFHIARDLYAAGVRWIPRRSRGQEQPDAESRDAPDLVLSIGRELIVCEGKFFHREPRGILEAQLRSQRRQIAYHFRYRPIRAFCHVALLPDPPFHAAESPRDRAKGHLLDPKRFLPAVGLIKSSGTFAIASDRVFSF